MICCNQITKLPALGTTVPVCLLQEALVISSSSRCHKFGLSGSEYIHCAYPNPVPLWFAAPWKFMTRAGRLLIWLNILIHRLSLKSCGHSGTSCNNSLRNSSSSSFLFVFSVSADPRDGFQSILLPFVDEMWFLTAGPVVGVPTFFAKFPLRKIDIYFSQLWSSSFPVYLLHVA